MQDITQYNSMTIEEVATKLNDILENKFVPAADAMRDSFPGTGGFLCDHTHSPIMTERFYGFCLGFFAGAMN